MKSVNEAFAGIKLQRVIFVVCACMHACTYQVCQHCILQTVCGNFTEFTLRCILGTRMNCLDFEVRGQKGQGHSQTKCSWISTLGGIAYKL